MSTLETYKELKRVEADLKGYRSYKFDTRTEYEDGETQVRVVFDLKCKDQARLLNYLINHDLTYSIHKEIRRLMIEKVEVMLKSHAQQIQSLLDEIKKLGGLE